MSMPEAGDAAPELALPDQDGEQHTLASHRGGWVVVYFYPQDETPGCTTQACGLRDAWDELRAAGVDVLGVSPDDVDSHASFAGNHDLPFTLLADPDRAAMTSWGAWGTKVLYGKEVTGVIRCAFLVDPDGVVRKAWRRVRTGAFAEHVLKAHAQLA